MMMMMAQQRMPPQAAAASQSAVQHLTLAVLPHAQHAAVTRSTAVLWE
jgi:hypothetical protein